jgi:lantibiotic modifying enzyme
MDLNWDIYKMETTNHTDIFFNTAWNIGMNLVRDAIWDNDRCNWLGSWVEPHEGKYVAATRSFGPDLYAGVAGIGYFLSILYSLEEDKLLKKTIEGAVNQVISTINPVATHGFYSGKPGIAFFLNEAGITLGRDDWREKGREILYSLDCDPANHHHLDVISGIAGTIPVLIKFFNHLSDTRLLNLAIKLGNILFEKAEKEDSVCSWPTVPALKNLTGFSHGAAGISTSLFELFLATNDRKYLDVAIEGINYEQKYFDVSSNNWPDFRGDINPGKVSNSIAWCHGAPGIALSRLRAFEISGIEEFRKQAVLALDTTYNETGKLLEQSANFSLCHGVAGNADILLQGSDKSYQELAKEIGLTGIERYSNTGVAWPSGTISNKSTPGLMMGLAGTGLFYLRLADPARFKTVLLPQV